MMHMDEFEGERRGHFQGVFRCTIKQDPATQHIILGQHSMHVLEVHVTHVDIVLVKVHAVQQDPSSRETTLPQELPIRIYA